MSERSSVLVDELRQLCAQSPRRLNVMEVCGTHTVSIFRAGLRTLFPENLRLVSGPGCPVCVTAQRHIDAALEIAARPDVILCTYGDMIRVPGRRGSLERLRACGARIQVVASAMHALELARTYRTTQVVFFAVGFETTAPASAALVCEAARHDLRNLSLLACHKLVVPALDALLQAPGVALDGFLAPGHVSVIIGSRPYAPVAEVHGRPVVITGFEPEQILSGLVAVVRQILAGQARVENVYRGVVRDEGNPAALRLLGEVFEPADTAWRELGTIPRSGLALRPAYAHFDALRRFDIAVGEDIVHPLCRCGEVITGRCEPAACAAFARQCTPLTPIGPCMVSGEGTCAAWYKYNRHVAAVGGAR